MVAFQILVSEKFGSIIGQGNENIIWFVNKKILIISNATVTFDMMCHSYQVYSYLLQSLSIPQKHKVVFKTYKPLDTEYDQTLPQRNITVTDVKNPQTWKPRSIAMIMTVLNGNINFNEVTRNLSLSFHMSLSQLPKSQV
jgi:hypothetical protein